MTYPPYSPLNLRGDEGGLEEPRLIRTDRTIEMNNIETRIGAIQ